MITDLDIIQKCAELNKAGTSYILLTVVSVNGSSPARAGFRMLVTENERYGTVGGGAVEKLLSEEAVEILRNRKELNGPELRTIELEKTGMSCGGTARIFIEHFHSNPDFVLFGGGHVGSALAPMLELIGYRITVFDNRQKIIAHTASDSRRIITASYEDISEAVPILKNGKYCFIATHGHEHDLTVLRQVLMSGIEMKYIGMIGSKMKVKMILDRLKDEGIRIPESLYAPVGLKIGGDTAAEIAVSVTAEIVSVNNKAQANHMRNRTE